MAHLKGSLAINPWRDIPLLRQVLSSTVISHSQLFELAKLGNCESKRDAFNWRLRRLVEYGLVSKQTLTHASPEPLYVITDSGNLCLQSHGDFYLSESPFLSGKRLEGVSICHCLQLNEIQLALLRSRHLNQWIPEARLLALMRLEASPYAKAYDAVVELLLERRLIRFGLEYEHTLKSARRYGEIREALEGERNVECVLYLTPSRELITALARHLGGCRRRIVFALVDELKENPLESRVFLDGHLSLRTLGDLLLEVPVRFQESLPFQPADK
jgi:hypothetical protein